MDPGDRNEIEIALAVEMAARLEKGIPQGSNIAGSGLVLANSSLNETKSRLDRLKTAIENDSGFSSLEAAFKKVSFGSNDGAVMIPPLAELIFRVRTVARNQDAGLERIPASQLEYVNGRLENLEKQLRKEKQVADVIGETRVVTRQGANDSDRRASLDKVRLTMLDRVREEVFGLEEASKDYAKRNEQDHQLLDFLVYRHAPGKAEALRSRNTELVIEAGLTESFTVKEAQKRLTAYLEGRKERPGPAESRGVGNGARIK